MQNAHQRIRQAMRRNELNLLTHLRGGAKCSTNVLGLWPLSWWAALNRLVKGGRIHWDSKRKRYLVAKGAQPVTR